MHPSIRRSPLRFACRVIPFFIGLLILASTAAHAQIQHGGSPYSFAHDIPGTAPVATMQPVDVAALLAKDQAERRTNRPIPPRFGTALDISLGLDNAGRWTDLPNGDRLWRLRIASQGAHSINLIFGR